MGKLGAEGAGAVSTRFADAVPVGLMVADGAGTIRFVNRRLEEMTGRSRTELVGLSVEELVPSSEVDAHTPQGEQVGDTPTEPGPMGGGVQTRLRTADGTDIPVDVELGFERTAQERLSIISIRDARDRIRLDALTEGSQRRLTELYEAVPLAIVGLDLDGAVTYANPQMRSLIGAPAGAMIGTDGLEWLIGADGDRKVLYDEILSRLDSSYHEARLQRGPGGHRRVVGWHSVPVHDEAGQCIGALSIGEDLTHRKRSELALESVRGVGMAVLSGESTDRIEQQVCDAARRLADVEYAILARPGTTGCEVSAVSGRGLEALVGAPVSAPWCTAAGAGPSVIAHEAFDDFMEPADIGFGPALMAPLAEPPSCGFLMVAADRDAGPFDQEVIESLRAFASQVNVVLEYGNRLRELAVIEDRERIARDLHDLVIQRIFSAGLTLQIAAQMVDDRPEVSSRLADVTASLDDAIGELRQSIAGLEARRGVSLRQQIDAVVADVTTGSGLLVEVEVPDELGPVPELLQRNLVATLREALANTVRHASAQRVRVVVTVGDVLVLEVEDDGLGFEASIGDEGRGLSNLAARAASLGGALHLSSLADGGLSLQWRVPLIVLGS